MPPRRSTRLAATSKKTEESKPAAVIPKDAKAKSPPCDTSKAESRKTSTRDKKPRKRVKADDAVSPAPEKPTSQRGILQQLTETPLDVLLEIFSYLEPLDLVRMSRTTKALRSLLMCKSSSSVWERARLRMEGLPPMFKGMSEPEYANLLFDSHCHNCLKGGTKYVQWQIRMRLCRACLDGGTIMATSHVLQNDYKDHPALPSDELLKITLNFTHCRKTVFLQFYDRECYDRLLNESQAFKRGTPEYDTWFLGKKKEYTALARECTRYEKWLESRTAERAAELAALRSERLSSIIDLLAEDGWEEELNVESTIWTLQGNRLVNQAKELTEQEWEAMKPVLTARMERVRADRLHRKMQTFKSDRIKLLQQLGDDLIAKLPETPPNPPASILLTHQLFLDILENTPFDQDVTVQFKEGLKNLPAICADWREKQEVHFKRMLREAGRSEDLFLAVNAFTCERCLESRRETPVHFPYFAKHACFTSRARVASMMVDVWDDKRIKVLSQHRHEASEKVIRLCGLDPAAASAQDMDDADAFLACGICCDKTLPSTVMRWRTAMNHQHTESLVRVTDPAIISLAERAEKSSVRNALASSPESYHDTAFVCIHCDVLADSAPSEHLLSAHGITGAAEDHYRRSLRNEVLTSTMVRPHILPLLIERRRKRLGTESGSAKTDI